MEVLRIAVDLSSPDRHVPAADHGQILHQIWMKRLAEGKQGLLFLGAGRQGGITKTLLISSTDLEISVDDPEA
jgi:hypothetical protein